METSTPFYTTPRAPGSSTSDRWSLVAGEDGAVEVSHTWTRPADPLLPTAGERRCSVRDFFREEVSDTAKRRLRDLLMARDCPA